LGRRLTQQLRILFTKKRDQLRKRDRESQREGDIPSAQCVMSKELTTVCGSNLRVPARVLSYPEEKRKNGGGLSTRNLNAIGNKKPLCGRLLS